VEESALERFGRQFGGLLTARELEVGELAVRGLSTRDLAKRLFISENTVKTHLRNVYRKTGTTNRGDLLRTLVMAPTADVDAVSER
jgi:DNA-binding CsgD family transcriptional regulator